MKFHRNSLPTISLIGAAINISSLEYFWSELPSMKGQFLILLLILILPAPTFSQASINVEDIEINTQLTWLEIDPADTSDFLKQMHELKLLANFTALNWQNEWLTYRDREGRGRYLIINFSDGLDDVLTISRYQELFRNKGKEQEFLNILDSISKLDILIRENFIIEMILPWSTVQEISVTEFPLSFMKSFSVKLRDTEKFDQILRSLCKLLLEAKYPYPLETSRGSLGAYGKYYQVWFHNNWTLAGKEELLAKLQKIGQVEDYTLLADKLSKIIHREKEYHLEFISNASY